MKKIILLLWAVPIWAGAQGSSASPERVPDFATATDMALNQNPQVQAAWHRFMASQDERDSAWGGYLPRVDASARVGYEKQEFPGPDTEFTYDIRGINLSITQMLYDGFATRSEVHRLDDESRARYFELLEQIESTTLDTYQAYQDVQRFRQLLAYARDNLNRHREVLEQITERVRSGVSRPVDLEQATARLALAESNLITENANLHDVSVRFQRIVGAMPGPDLALAPTPVEGMPTDLRAILGAAYAENPGVIAAASSLEASQDALQGSQAAYHPRLELQLSGEVGEDIDRIQNTSRDLRAQLVLGYNLFNGLSDAAAIRQAADLKAVANDLLNLRCRNLRQDLRIAHNDTERLQAQLRFLEVQRQSVDKARVAYFSQFRLGQRSLLDLLDTENEFFDTRRAYSNAQYDLNIAQARVYAGMGRLAGSLQVMRGEMPDASEFQLERSAPYCPVSPGETLSYEYDDSDGDGVADGKDACPGTPPGVPVDAVGCRKDAIGDQDGDGVPDYRDLCPNTPPGVKVDASGCKVGRKVVLQGVNFAVNSASLTGNSTFILQPVVRMLKENPRTRIEISGHTDSSGSSEYNYRLSQDRADSVRQYLIDQGVRPGQVQAQGWGPSKPLSSNDTAQGRSDNRRVEFRVLQPGE